MRRLVGLILVVFGAVLAAGGLLFGGSLLLQMFGRNGGPMFVPALIALGVGLLGVVMVVAGARAMRGAKPLGEDPISAGGRAGAYVVDRPETRWFGERQYVVYYKKPVRGKHSRPSSLVISVPATTPTTLRFTNESWFDRLSKRWGIVNECQTSDAEFDDGVYVRCQSDGYIAQVLADEDKRLAVRAILRHGMQGVRLTGTHAEASWTGFDPATNDRPDFAQEVAAGLYVLANGLPSVDPDRESNRLDRRSTWHILLWTFVGAMAAMFAFMFWYSPVHGDELFWAGMLLFAVLYPLFSFIAIWLLRGQSTSHDRLLILMSVGLVLLGFGCVGAVAGVNGLADDSPAQTRQVTVAEKRASKQHRGGTNYSVRVPAWDRDGETIRFSVSAENYDRTVPGQTQLEVTTHDGALGIPWVEDYEVLQ